MDQKINVLLLGGGGREHAMAWKMAQSDRINTLYCAPGNPGMQNAGVCVNLSGNDQVVQFARDNNIDLVVVGPEAPLADGIADDLSKAGVLCFGPTAAAAQLETSKGFTKGFCDRHNIPTAGYRVVTNIDDGHAFFDTLDAPYVLKADGLAAGKGVVIAETRQAADAALADMLDGQFGDASASVVIEEFMHGEEVSVFAICDGKTALLFGNAQDHKRVGEGDTGPNTGGMGTYSPAPVLTPSLEKQVMDTIIAPTMAGMQAEGNAFCGVLYAGLMLTKDGPKLVEYNVRFGDPEAQVLMTRLADDIVPYFYAAANGTLDRLQPPNWHNQAAMCVVYAANGYPAAPKKGGTISGLQAATDAGTTIFHAGTKMDGEHLVANGGRVLNICALGTDLSGAADTVYSAIKHIKWDDGFYRKDIGWRALKMPEAAQ